MHARKENSKKVNIYIYIYNLKAAGSVNNERIRGPARLYAAFRALGGEGETA